MLAKMPKQTGGDAMKARLQDVTELPPSYKQLGIHKVYAARWQAEARVPDQHYHAYQKEHLLTPEASFRTRN